ncbi:hypothetical protein GHT06_001835 [Daphnia sinensis]|uniref:Uncharacterized protein n=1 Tax=Daphnia sinensis TaxID=1820382 RepID=A0AAD5PNC9_9CRUS|nr:hypothetical protein GHT06_001835 [Daphnia sinensis]
MGINNNTQGFRDNFSSIKSNLDIASTEITDLEDKAILKAPLTGRALNNDMNNNIISNMLTRGSRQTTTALGYDLSGKVYIDVNAAEVMDVGATIQVTPLVHSSKLKQLTARTPSATGQPGDVAGSTYFDSGNLYVCIKDYDGTWSSGKRFNWGTIMLHPFVGDLSDMTMDELLVKINDLNGKMMFARRSGNLSVVNQMTMIIESYQTEYRKKVDEQYKKYNIGNDLIKVNK